MLDNRMLEEFVAMYLGEKDKKLEQQFREKLGVRIALPNFILVAGSGHL